MAQLSPSAIRHQLAVRVIKQSHLLDKLLQRTSSDPQFLEWRRNTRLLLIELGNGSPHLQSLDQLSFRSYPQLVARGTRFPEGQLLDHDRFASDCLTAKELLRDVARALREHL